MRNSTATLVVGTTADYIDWIENRSRSRAIFLTAIHERHKAAERFAPPQRELLTDLTRSEQCIPFVQSYLRATGVSLDGIACFDDESLPLAAMLAQALALEFPSVKSILRSLDKQAAKEAWMASGVPCPKAIAVSGSLDELDTGEICFPCVLKPHSASGSERVFLCHTRAQARHAAIEIIDSAENDTAVAEEYIVGEEFSCDFVIDDGHVQILRTARKHMAATCPLGTALAYSLPSHLDEFLYEEILGEVLRNAATSLGISRAICMVDFIVRDEEIFLIELSPRMGGDCLPHVMLEAWGVDAIGRAMEFYRGESIGPWLNESAPTVVGLRIFSQAAGKVSSVNTHEIDEDARIISHTLKESSGRVVVMPPQDYSSWLLGHVVFQPYAARDVEEQIRDFRERISISLEDLK